jgi:hypothetical protein
VPVLAGADLDDPGAGPSSTRRMPITSTLSTSGFTSPVSTMLLPPPRMNLGRPARAGSASSSATSASPRDAHQVAAPWPRCRSCCAAAARRSDSTTIMGELSPKQPANPRVPAMPSFDTVCEPNLPEVKNAVDNTAKEIGTRFDFKGTAAAVELKDKEITMIGDADFQLVQVEDILAPS